MKHFYLLITLLLGSMVSTAQEVDLNYYLPDIEYDQSITTPEDFLGHQVGEWHVTHDKLYYYMRELATQSDRITLTEFGRTHEDRPLIYLTITSPDNHSNIETIKSEHKKLTNTIESKSVNIDELPIVIYQGCSIHGNEPSGANGALAMVYYLAAAQGDKINKMLDEMVILFDPSFNPDGLQRFSTWVNTHKGDNLISDPNSREYNEVWPGGRTNHFWFDLNRDWLLLTHPESQGRIRVFHEWKPDILTDHHEMGSNSTFFFQPGIPSRTNPNTPELNQVLTAKIGEFHAKALDRIGSLYYTKESYDDYYYGKGSTYPDAQGSIGILFEQASSRGHLQATDHGLLSFPFTIRNQVATMFSTQDAAQSLRKEILEYKRQSFIESRQLAKRNPVKGYAFGDDHDPYKVNRFIDILLQHQIEVYQVKDEMVDMAAETQYYVPLDQDQYKLSKSIFEKVTTYEDSLFYDVSAWTLPLAFDIPYQEVKKTNMTLDRIEAKPTVESGVIGNVAQTYAYLIQWEQYLAPRLLNQMQKAGLIVKLSNEPFTTTINGELLEFKRGTLIIPTGNNQRKDSNELDQMMKEWASDNHLIIHRASTGMVQEGFSLGTRSSNLIEDPRAMILIGEGVRSYDAGEIWHHFDQVLDMAVPMIELQELSRVDLSQYKTIIMTGGRYNALNDMSAHLKEWIQEGGTIIAMGSSINWLKGRGLLAYKTVKGSEEEKVKRPYERANEDSGALYTGGMIAKGHIDTTHPLFYGYSRDATYFFRRGNTFIDATEMSYSAPARYTKEPIVSGYLHKTNNEMMSESAAVFTESIGRGKVIAILDNPLFRGYWWGGSKLFANALFFGSNID